MVQQGKLEGSTRPNSVILKDEIVENSMQNNPCFNQDHSEFNLVSKKAYKICTWSKKRDDFVLIVYPESFPYTRELMTLECR